jgi:hypothetical protein
MNTKDILKYTSKKLKGTWEWVTEDTEEKITMSFLFFIGGSVVILLLVALYSIIFLISDASHLNKKYLGKQVSVGEIKGIVTSIKSDNKLIVVTNEGRSFECNESVLKLLEETEKETIERK